MKSVSINPNHYVAAEINHNRYANPTVIQTGISDVEPMFPVASVVLPNRPKQGILKARGTDMTRWRNSGSPVVEGYVQGGYATPSVYSRSYTVSDRDKYKYWACPNRSGTVASGGYYAISNASLEVTYSKDVTTNMIVAQFEASVVKPRDITIYYKTTAAGAWTQITGTFQVDTEGKVVIWRQSNGTWNTTEDVYYPMTVRGIKVVVASLDRADAYLNVIEIGARYKIDITDYVNEYTTNYSVSEQSFITPLGVASSNEASLTLSNVDGTFNNDNSASPFYGLVDKNIKITCDLGIDTSAYSGSGFEYTRQFTMYTDEWGSPNEETMEVTLKDSSKFLQEEKPLPGLYQNITVGEAIWRMMDGVGMNNYLYDYRSANPNDTASQIDYYWTDPETTVWDHFAKIAQATQTAVYFDEYDVLKIQTRAAAYDLGKAIDWTLDAVPVTASDVSTYGRPGDELNKLPDIIELNKNYDYEANVVNVKHVDTQPGDFQNGNPVMETVWEPEDTVVLRAVPMFANITAAQMYGMFRATDLAVWPYTGMINLEGEIIEFDAKEYAYYNASGTVSTGYVTSNEEKEAFDKVGPLYAFKNYFTGKLRFKTRGLWGTVIRDHYLNPQAYTGRLRAGTGTISTTSAYYIRDYTNSILKLNGNSAWGGNTWYVVSRNAATSTAPKYYGTRFKFSTSGYAFGAAGLAVGLGNNDGGFYVDIIRTAVIGSRTQAHELNFYYKYSGGTIQRWGPDGTKGVPVQIDAGINYDLTVAYTDTGTGHAFSIALNGVTKMNITVPKANSYTGALANRYGMFVRGDSDAEFEYLFAGNADASTNLDESNLWDLVNGGYVSSISREAAYYDISQPGGWSRRYVTTNTWQKIQNFQYDEFGPIAHEMRLFDITFTKKPNLHSRLYWSNETQIACPIYTSTPFGAKFLLANTARVNAVVSGDDTLMFGEDNPVDQKLFVYGRLISQDDAKEYTVQNDDAIRRRGRVEVDVESTWIQNEAQAKAIGDWITQHWAGGSDELEVELFGNPLIQLGDLVGVNYPAKSLNRTNHRYFVVKVRNSYDGGLTTTLTLRRAKA